MRLFWIPALLLLIPGCGEGAEGEDFPLADPSVVASAPDSSAAVPAPDTARDASGPDAPREPLPRPTFVRPEAIRGIYLNAWAAGSANRSTALIELARATEINSFVIDVKDASGFVSYPTDVAMAGAIGADQELRIRDMRALLTRLSEEGIWPIARIVVFKDPILAAANPAMAVQDSTGAPWVDGKGHVWVNPWNERVWEYHIELAREAIEMGFPEIQWDYIRFPDRPASEMARAGFPGENGRPRTEAVRGFLVRARDELAPLGVSLTADVFGVSTSFTHDVGIGQIWESFIDVVDAALPMVYPSHYWEGSFGITHPNGHPYEVITNSIGHAIRRNEAIPGAGRIIPWLQDFTLGSPPYGIPEVRAQILAVEDLGLEEWILWNASSRYTEGALQPVGGWGPGEEPPIRWGGAVVPAENRLRREEVPDTLRNEPG